MNEQPADASAPDGVEAEVERRLQLLREDPELRARYDRNGDGLVDEQEWEAVRRMLRAEVRTERRRRTGEVAPGGRAHLPELPEGELLRERFELRHKIGEGGQGFTYLGWDLDDGDLVAVKELDLGQTDDWKAIELFEREGEALEALSHPKIPGYVDAFHVDADEPLFFLVQEYVDGEALEALLDGGETFDEEEVRSFVAEMLEILGYIHGRSPPVVHRDVKPSNIIRRPDGTHALVDFGAVQTILPDEVGGSTVVGTSGYMPVEQLMGRSTPQTDLYALGATAIHLLSRQHPSELPVEGMKLDFRDRINVARPFADFLARMVEPHAEDRFASAEAAAEALDRPGGSSPDVSSETNQPLQRRSEHGETGLEAFNQSAYRRDLAVQAPLGSEVDIKRDGETTAIAVPEAGFTSNKALSLALQHAGRVPVTLSLVASFVANLAWMVMGGRFGPGQVFLSALAVFGGYVAVRISPTVLRSWRVTLDETEIAVDEQLPWRAETRVIPIDQIWSLHADEEGIKFLMGEREYHFADIGDGDEIAWVAYNVREHLEATDVYDG
jgi:serine/threonine protein kinase